MPRVAASAPQYSTSSMRGSSPLTAISTSRIDCALLKARPRRPIRNTLHLEEPMPRAFNRRSFLASASRTFLAAPLLRQSERVASAGMSAHAPRLASPAPAVTLSVRDFGAAGDGVAKDTAAIQQALDRCAVLGGGEVHVPPGNYFTGAVALRANTLLRLDKDAALIGTPDFADYPVTQVRWEGKWIQGHTGLIYAIDAANLGVVGPGKIVGNPALGGRPNASNPL